MGKSVDQRTSIGALAAALLAACAGVQPSPSSEPAPPPLTPTRVPAPAAPPGFPTVLARATVVAVGDVLPHGAVQQAAAAAGADREGWSALLAGVRDSLSVADLGFANLETPIAPRTGGKVQSFQFNAPPALLPALKDAGIDVVSFANNHVYDQGRAGFAETLEQLAASPLAMVGAGSTCAEASAARMLDPGGIKVALIGSSTLFNQDLNAGPDEPCSFLLDEARVGAEAQAARAQGAEVVILSVHWGTEYTTAPRQDQIDLAHRLIESGVDVILGHHPHVLQPVEIYRAQDGRLALVAYSLGNFISNQSRTYEAGVHPAKMGNTRDGVALHFSLVRKDYGAGVHHTELAEVRVEPLWTDNNALERGGDPKLPPVIRVVSVDRELQRIDSALAAGPDEAERTLLLRRSELLRERRRIAGTILGEDLLE